MKKFTLLLFFNLFLLNSQSQPMPKGGEFIFDNDNHSCVTLEQRQAIINDLKASEIQLKKAGKLIYNANKKGASVLFSWPVQKADSFSYNDVWGISNYVDHNSAYPNQLQDYNCGTRTYDLNSGYNHQGLDIFSWPFGWRMMDNNEAVIVAAAPGQIIFKHDGEYDRNCAIAGTLTWNAVYIQHTDGTIAWYGHMKNGSTTTKNVGDTVVEGEILGVIGSSGYSTGPHLHFEVWEDSSYSNLIDPYAGTCNNMNVQTKWQNQKPYREPKVNAMLTHFAAPIFNDCPTTETTNESDSFTQDDTIYFGLYMRDQLENTTVNLKIIKPDGSFLYNWNFNLTSTYNASWWYWFFSGVYDQVGTWTWESTYQGETVSHTFEINENLSIEDFTIDSSKIYPNPFTNTINIDSQLKITTCKLFDVSGKLLLEKTNQSGITKINSEGLSQGIYFLEISDKLLRQKNIKLVKK